MTLALSLRRVSVTKPNNLTGMETRLQSVADGWRQMKVTREVFRMLLSESPDQHAMC